MLNQCLIWNLIQQKFPYTLYKTNTSNLANYPCCIVIVVSKLLSPFVFSEAAALTLKEPGGGGESAPSTFFVISQPDVIFSPWNFMTFFLQALRSI